MSQITPMKMNATFPTKRSDLSRPLLNLCHLRNLWTPPPPRLSLPSQSTTNFESDTRKRLPLRVRNRYHCRVNAPRPCLMQQPGTTAKRSTRRLHIVDQDHVMPSQIDPLNPERTPHVVMPARRRDRRLRRRVPRALEDRGKSPPPMFRHSTRDQVRLVVTPTPHPQTMHRHRTNHQLLRIPRLADRQSQPPTKPLPVPPSAMKLQLFNPLTQRFPIQTQPGQTLPGHSLIQAERAATRRHRPRTSRRSAPRTVIIDLIRLPVTRTVRLQPRRDQLIHKPTHPRTSPVESCTRNDRHHGSGYTPA
jgi:hypothetical protein